MEFEAFSYQSRFPAQIVYIMATPTSESPPQHTIDAMIQLLKPKHVRDGHDTLFLVLHAFMISAGFRLVGLGDDGSFLGMLASYSILLSLLRMASTSKTSLKGRKDPFSHF